MSCIMSAALRSVVAGLVLTVGLSAAQAEDPQAIDVFAAIDAGQIEARFIARNPYEARLRVQNLTDQPLTIRMPDLVGGSPVLAQFNFNFPPPGNNNNNSLGQQGSPNQSVGGGTPTPIFNIPAEGLREIELKTVCLEFGKRNPRSSMQYRLVPIEVVASDKAVQHVLREYVHEDREQAVVQAAAWHLANGKSWQELSQVPGARHVYKGRLPLFSQKQLDEARELVTEAQDAATKDKPIASPIETTAQVERR